MFHPLDDPERYAFPFTAEQIAVGEAARAFGRERVAPGAAERDRTCAYPLDLIGDLASLGLMAMKVDPDDGGSGLDNVAYLLAMQGIAEADASVAVILASSNLVAWILGRHADADQRRRWLAPYAAGELGTASFAPTEPGAGSDASAIRAVARDDGDAWVLDGGKMWITSGAHAGLHLVFAKTDPDAGARGISCFVVPRGAPGLHVGREEDKMGQRASGTVALHLDGCRVPKDHLIGGPGDGYRVALSALGGGRIGIAGLCLGLGEAAFTEGVGYASRRVAFGERVVDFQHSRFAVADSRADLDGAWLLALRAARVLDARGQAALESSMAKVAASEAADRVIDRMLQLHGGYGYSKEYRIERLYRDNRVTRIYEGSNEIQRIVMGREIVRRLDA